tara:strand:+ start:445 stop:816 length:372 start_codon:yes stop_codon:yes gene_type:complete
MVQNRLEDRTDRLTERLQDEAGRSVDYQQGITTVSAVVATPVDEFHEIFNEDGISTRVQFRSWIVEASDLSAIDEPRPGDRITDTIDSVEYIFEVQPIDEKRPCVEWFDTSRKMFLIHSIRVQ